MRIALLCFAIVVLGLRGIAWNADTEVGHGVKKVVRQDILEMSETKPAPRKPVPAYTPPTYSPVRL